MLALIPVTDNRESIHDVLHFIMFETIKPEIGGIKRTAKVEATLSIPNKWRTGEAHLIREWRQFHRCVSQFKSTIANPFSDSLS